MAVRVKPQQGSRDDTNYTSREERGSLTAKLRSLFRRYNHRYFDNRLSAYRVYMRDCISPKGMTFLYGYCERPVILDGRCVTPARIHISTETARAGADGTLLHEMAHAAVSEPGHGEA